MNTSFIKVNILPNGVSRCLSASQGVSWCLLVSDVVGYFSWHLYTGFSCSLRVSLGVS